MAININDDNSTYQQAMTAYVQGNYEVAATLVSQVVQNFPDDPNSHLLRGHTYYVLQQYDIAKAEYHKVLDLTDDQEIVGFANNGIESINSYLRTLESDQLTEEPSEIKNAHEISNEPVTGELELLDLGVDGELDNTSFDMASFGDYQPSEDALEDISESNPFNIAVNNTEFNATPNNSVAFDDDPFALDQQFLDPVENSGEESGALELPAFWQEDNSSVNIEQSFGNSPFTDFDLNSEISEEENNSPFGLNNNWQPTPELIREEDSPELEEMSLGNLDFANESQEDINIGVAEQEINNSLTNNDLSNIDEDISFQTPDNWLNQIPEETNSASVSNSNHQGSLSLNSNLDGYNPQVKVNSYQNLNNFDDDSFDPEAFDRAFGSESFGADEDNSSILSGENSANKIDFLDDFGDFGDFDDIGSIPSFDLTGDADFDDLESESSENRDDMTSSFTDSLSGNSAVDRDRSDDFTITGSQDAVSVFTLSDAPKLEPNVTVDQGLFGFFENASLEKKQWYIAGTVGLTSAVVAALISFGATSFSPSSQRESVRNTGWAMALAAGLAGGVTAGFMGNLTLKQIRRTTKDLQTQFDAVREGNLNVQATVYSEDELGYLATSFNDMSRVIFTTTNEAQRKAVEQEEAKENLQRQVIRLLDDVEGAARGDLTVQAEVTADVLGAVADAFNLTIQNLRDIVQQVKVAAREVTKGSTNSETFARALSGDALRQAEELAVTLNSVQVMTESIQRVAVAAKEAETVARDASAIALKGGEAVENTVAGILEIRETVAETTRKVKRLAESSQEINSIVALVSQIASRTNLLALNASIEAARAGEAGRGFAIVADEVRQLADKSAKSLKEIEQIVMQIQSETSSVMTAMEEGTQQVIQGTKLAEEAKRSLENIIEVAKHIDTLVRSITSDTVEQTETSRAVAQVMQSVELTAQETSQEAQRVSGALQHLVGVSRDLIASVERFRVETIESR
ncbi:methyl-accepting chemotaxis protein [Anabaena sp. PCC 7108]|uniref:methyl-accepting chemotaxis protein n=1 Tax=Anabaena sp. PCC 7108 TaxID=163908 RepID=UPI00034D5B77|nr:methyl-accepting chemotaxis protein [Anabaena sp. PCC 7108]